MHILQKPTVILLFSFLLVGLFSSCVNTKKIAYFNDITGDSAIVKSEAGLEPVIQKKDILSISVSSLDPKSTEIFNLPNLPITPNASSNTATPQTAGYLVDDEGNIKFPMLGKIKAEGLTKNQLEDTIAQALIKKQLLFDPVVTARFLNFRVTVLGEVAHPGVVYAPNDQMSILEAIGQAGDLTIYGLRDNILLIRQEGPDKIIKRLNLNSSDILSSPYFFLKSNDVVYVEPGKNKATGTDFAHQNLPLIFSGVTVLGVILSLLLK